MPRRSGTTTVWSFASSAAIGDHMSPVLPKPWISTTAGPCPPTRTLIVASAFTTCELRKSAGKGVGAARAAGIGSRVDDMGDIADPLHRRHRLQKLVRRRIVHRRIYDSRRDRIDPNAFRRQLERKRASRLVDTAFDEDGEERRNVRLWLTR